MTGTIKEIETKHGTAIIACSRVMRIDIGTVSIDEVIYEIVGEHGGRNRVMIFSVIITNGIIQNILILSVGMQINQGISSHIVDKGTIQEM